MVKKIKFKAAFLTGGSTAEVFESALSEVGEVKGDSLGVQDVKSAESRGLQVG